MTWRGVSSIGLSTAVYPGCVKKGAIAVGLSIGLGLDTSTNSIETCAGLAASRANAWTYYYETKKCKTFTFQDSGITLDGVGVSKAYSGSMNCHPGHNQLKQACKDSGGSNWIGVILVGIAIPHHDSHFYSSSITCIGSIIDTTIHGQCTVTHRILVK